MRLTLKTALLGLLAPLAGCTLITDAGDREIVTALDIDFTFGGLSTPHPSGPLLDVAVVLTRGQDKQVQGRALISLPPPPPPGSGPDLDQRLVLQRALQQGKMELLFYVDDKPADAMFESEEHHWVRTVPANGQGRFDHVAFFEQFFEFKQGSDLVLAGPSSPAQRDCLQALLGGFGLLEIKIVNTLLGRRQDGYVKLNSASGLPVRSLRLAGLVDEGSSYGFEVLVDGVAARIFDKPSTGELQVSLAEWFPAPADQIARCVP